DVGELLEVGVRAHQLLGLPRELLLGELATRDVVDDAVDDFGAVLVLHPGAADREPDLLALALDAHVALPLRRTVGVALELAHVDAGGDASGVVAEQREEGGVRLQEAPGGAGAEDADVEAVEQRVEAVGERSGAELGL